MLLVNEENEITHLTDRVSDMSDSVISLHVVNNRCCCCFKKSTRVSWEKVIPIDTK